MNTSSKSGAIAGELLRSKRKELNISIADIAKQLHLKANFITALEQDDYDKLPGPTYVRGYIRAYAKAVGIDEKSVVDLFDAEVVSAPPLDIFPKKKHRAQISSSDKPVRAFTYIVTLSLVILVLIWYRSHYLTPANTTDTAQTEESKNISKPAFDYEFSVVIHPPGWQNVVEREDLATNKAADEEVRSEVIPLPASDEAHSDENQINIPSFGPDKLKMLIHENSWIEISDSTGEKLFFGTGRTGQTIILSGNAPFEILFGYAPGIKLFYKDRPFDTEPHIAENGVARFTLDN